MIQWIIISVAMGLLVLATILGGSTLVPDVQTAIFFVLLAVAACALASIVGLGGGLVIVPVLIFLGLSPPIAAFSSLAATMSNATASSMVYAKQRRIEYKEAVKLGLMAIPGSVLGAALSKDAGVDLYSVLLAGILISAGVYVYIRPRLRNRPHPGTFIFLSISVGVSFFAGVVSSYFGIGGGVIFVPLLVILSGMSVMRAAPTSIMALLLTSVAGIVTHGVLGDTAAILALLLSAGGLLGGMAGAKLSREVGERYTRILVLVTMIAAAITLIWNSSALDIT
ncbi:MAG: sulfite exporter TauE/SafE family protein [Cenarchaeum sp. SB0662_bin_33]|nr:sulfite exporter TauE/SafE family protein [Cenarchaeum sp. SB0662_bin_33]